MIISHTFKIDRLTYLVKPVCY